MALTPRLSFGGFELDPQSRRLTFDGRPVPLADCHFDVLHCLVSNPDTVIAKETLVRAGWGDVAVTDNSLEQAVSALRRAVGGAPAGQIGIETVPRRGYRFHGTVTRLAARESDDALEAMLAPHRAWLEGRAALETLARGEIVRSREVFEGILRAVPGHALAHVGLANACAMQFETTRADERPDTAALATAAEHAREACRLEPESGEAWATCGFVLDRSGHNADARAALRRAVTLEPDNWRHHFRLAYVSWGEERLRAARRTLAILPGFPLAHWLVATVEVARNVLDDAERELAAGIAVQESQGEHGRFSPVALHWLRGLVHLASGDEPRAESAFERELSFEATGHLFARECCANTWYALGALRLRQRRTGDARAAFTQALDRVPGHPLARLALAAVTFGDRPSSTETLPPSLPQAGHVAPVDLAICRAAFAVLQDRHAEGARLVDEALAAAGPGGAGWLLPVEPLLHVSARPGVWSAPLARLRARSA